MSLADRFANYERPSPGVKCVSCNLLNTLPESEAKAFDAALGDKTVSSLGISQIMKSEGYKVGETSVRRHRRVCMADES